jgi:hypothetical protein
LIPLAMNVSLKDVSPLLLAGRDGLEGVPPPPAAKRKLRRLF